MTQREKNPRRTRRKMMVLDYIRTTIASDGQPPSYGMICEALNIGTRTEVHMIIKRLEADRLVSRVGSGRVRRIRLTSKIQEELR